MIETRTFDYKGFHSKKAYWKNKMKSLVGKGDSKESILQRRKRLIEYYKKNPKDLKTKGKSESKKSFEAKLRSSKSSVVSRRANTLTREIRKTGSKYTPGQASKIGARIAAPLAVMPIPGTTVAAGVAVGGGTLIDKIKMAHLRRNKLIKNADESLKNIERDINDEDKIQNYQKKILLRNKK